MRYAVRNFSRQIALSAFHRAARGSLATSSLFVMGALALSACSSSSYVRHAKRGEYTQLQRELSAKTPSVEQARKTASALLSYEVEHAKDLQDRAFVHGLASCASPIYGALRKRSKTHDGTGAEAAMILLEAGHLNRNPQKFKNDEDGGFRALAARASISKDEQRRGFFVDPDERVRRAALRAAIIAADPEDVSELLEVARLDPDPLARSQAFQALGKIGGAFTVRSLSDAYPGADEALRLAIVDAWSSPALMQAGGLRELERLLTNESGLPSVVAAARLTHQQDAALTNLAMARLMRFAQNGSVDERRLALRLMPLRDKQSAAIFLAARGDIDKDIAVIAWARLLTHENFSAEARKVLTEWASSDDPVAPQAQAALAAVHIAGVRELLLKNLKHHDSTTRIQAARGLIALGALADAALLLGDSDASVRRQVACQLVARAPIAPEDN